MTQKTLSDRLIRKIQTQLRIVYITDKKPKQKIKLDPIDPENININLETVIEWSQQNKDLYSALLQNGMAAHICNKQFLFEFYQSINFAQQGIQKLDQQALRMKNLHFLNLTQNRIQNIQNIPENLKVLLLDHNYISQINVQKTLNLEMLSLSHNQIGDKAFKRIVKYMPSLRCLNIAYNSITSIANFIQEIKNLKKVKILISLGNPISLLKIYWKYVTENVELEYFQNQKYIKPQPIQIKKRIQPPKVEQKKQDKKDIKKDNKKGGKVQQKVIQQPIVVQVEEPIKQLPIQLNAQNSRVLRLNVVVSNFQQYQPTINGFILDPSTIPENTQPNKTQTTYWVDLKLSNENISGYQKRVSFDTATIEDGQWRINLQFIFENKYALNLSSQQLIQNGLVLTLWKEQPKTNLDPESGQAKPQILQNQIVRYKTIIGSVFVDLRRLYKIKSKKITQKFRLFSNQVINQPLFQNPYHNQDELIGRNLEKFEEKLKKIEYQKQKKVQEQQASKTQKKGGKDLKKPPADKKTVKKDAKDVVISDKKRVQKSTYEINQKLYCYLGQQKMHKGSKQLLSISVEIM